MMTTTNTAPAALNIVPSEVCDYNEADAAPVADAMIDLADVAMSRGKVEQAIRYTGAAWALTTYLPELRAEVESLIDAVVENAYRNGFLRDDAFRQIFDAAQAARASWGG